MGTPTEYSMSGCKARMSLITPLYSTISFYIILNHLSSFRICDVGLPVEGEIPDEGVPLTNCHDVQDCDQPSALTKLPARVPDR
jgi:hypothetical protein